MQDASTGRCRLRLEHVRVSPENEETGLWFQWTSSLFAQKPTTSTNSEAEEDVEGNNDEVGESSEIVRISGNTHIMETVCGDFQYSADLPPITLSEKCLNCILTDEDTQKGAILLKAFRGETGKEDGDQFIGQVLVPLEQMITSDDKSFAFDVDFLSKGELGTEEEEKEANELETLQLRVVLEADTELRQFLRGSKILRFTQGRLTDAHERWGMPNFRTKVKLELAHGIDPPCIFSHLNLESEDPENDQSQEDRRGIVDFVNQSGLVFLNRQTANSMMQKANFRVECSLIEANQDENNDSVESIKGLGELDLSQLWGKEDVSSTAVSCKITYTIQLEPEEKDGEEDEGELPKQQSITETMNFDCTIISNPSFVLSQPIAKVDPLTPWDLIERRVPASLPPKSAEAILNEDVEALIDVIVKEYSSIISKAKNEIIQSQENEKRSPTPVSLHQTKNGRKQLLYHAINSSATYSKMREQLVQAIIRIVKENPELSGKEQDETFICDLYSYVLSLIHRQLNLTFEAAKKGIPLKVNSNIPEGEEHYLNSDTVEILKSSSLDAQIRGDLDRADSLHQERVGVAERLALLSDTEDAAVDPSVWMDWGVFALYRLNYGIATECFRSAIAIDCEHVPTLLAYGALLLQEGTLDDAEVFLLATKQSLQKAQETLPDGTQKKTYSSSETHSLVSIADGFLKYLDFRKDNSTPIEANQDNLKSLTAAIFYCLKLGLPKIPTMLSSVRNQMISNIEFLNATEKQEARFLTYFAHAWSLYVQQEFDEANNVFEKAIDIIDTLSTVWLLWGSLKYKLGELEDASQYYERALHINTDSIEGYDQFSCSTFEFASACHNLGQLYMSESKFNEARDTFLKLCNYGAPSAEAWIGVGVSCLNLAQYEDAQLALSEANVYDRNNPEIWGFLCLACQRKPKPQENLAVQCFQQAMKNNLINATLLCEIGEEFISQGKHNFALESVRKSFEITPGNAIIRSNLVKVLQLMNKFEEAAELEP